MKVLACILSKSNHDKARVLVFLFEFKVFIFFRLYDLCSNIKKEKKRKTVVEIIQIRTCDLTVTLNMFYGANTLLP